MTLELLTTTVEEYDRLNARRRYSIGCKALLYLSGIIFGQVVCSMPHAALGQAEKPFATYFEHAAYSSRSGVCVYRPNGSHQNPPASSAMVIDRLFLSMAVESEIPDIGHLTATITKVPIAILSHFAGMFQSLNAVMKWAIPLYIVYQSLLC
jgi:hypothetical protein